LNELNDKNLLSQVVEGFCPHVNLFSRNDDLRQDD
jgi:hypothetical protein